MAITARSLLLLQELRQSIGGETDDAVRVFAAAWSSAWSDLSAAWVDALDQVLNAMDRLGRPPTPYELARLDRLAAATAQSQTAIALLVQQSTAAANAGVAEIVAAAAGAEPAIIAAQMPAEYVGRAMRAYTRRIVPDVLESITLRTQQQINARHWPLSVDAVEAMRRALVVGIAAGDNPRTAARQIIRDVEGAFNGGLSRAMVIARTEMIDAYRDTAMHVHQVNRAVLDGWVWISSLDRRQCPACWAMHGTEWPVDQPGPWGHQQCIPAGAEVFGPGVVASTTRWFVGQLVEITTEQGRRLSVTPNHPVLTTQGWVNAGELHQGHHVVTAAPRERDVSAAGTDPDHYQSPALIEDVARSFDGPGTVGSVVVPTTPVDFHGDGAGSEVHVVRADRALLDDVKTGRAQPLGHGAFFRGDVGVPGQPRRAVLPRDGHLAELLESLGHAPGGGLGGGHDLPVLLRGAQAGLQPVAFGHGPQGHARVGQAAVDQAARPAERLGDGVARFTGQVAAHDVVRVDAGAGHHRGGDLLAAEGVPLGDGAEQAAFFEMADEDGRAETVPGRGDIGRFAGQVGTDRVVDVRRRDFSGHVYNLQTVDGWYAANEIVTHNCRCARMPKAKTWRELGINLPEPPSLLPDAKQRFAALDDEQRLQVMGRRRLALLDEGVINLADLAAPRPNPNWRTSYAPMPVRDLDAIAARRRAVAR